MSARDQQSFGRSEPVETLDAYFDRWSRLHGDLDPRGSSLIRGWLTFAYRVAKPLTRTGLSPNGVTIAGVVVAGAVPLLCWIGINASNSVWLWLAVAVTALSGLLDNLDGAVAVISGRTTRGGYVLDSVADRFADAALLGALWVVGAPGWIVAGAVFIGFVQEYARARAAIVGVSEVGVVSISERPTRIVIAAVFLGLAAWAPYGVAASSWASIGATAAFATGLIGLAQVGLTLARRLR